jgi:biofilm PGA synthesis N-glycosyltransferase PgaC
MIDVAIPFLDLAYVAVWPPGLALACTGRFWVVGPMTHAGVPMTLLLYLLLYRTQKRSVFAPLGLTPRRDPAGFLLFVTVYQAFMSVMAVRGYAQHLLNRKFAWM